MTRKTMGFREKSTKTRIETGLQRYDTGGGRAVLEKNPPKQGLKQYMCAQAISKGEMF